MGVFSMARTGPGEYKLGLGAIDDAVTIKAPDDALASQWALCCMRALNEREALLRMQDVAEKDGRSAA